MSLNSPGGSTLQWDTGQGLFCWSRVVIDTVD